MFSDLLRPFSHWNSLRHSSVDLDSAKLGSDSVFEEAHEAIGRGKGLG